MIVVRRTRNASQLLLLCFQDLDYFWFQAGHAGGFAGGYGLFVGGSVGFFC